MNDWPNIKNKISDCPRGFLIRLYSSNSWRNLVENSISSFKTQLRKQQAYSQVIAWSTKSPTSSPGSWSTSPGETFHKLRLPCTLTCNGTSKITVNGLTTQSEIMLLPKCFIWSLQQQWPKVHGSIVFTQQWRLETEC